MSSIGRLTQLILLAHRLDQKALMVADGLPGDFSHRSVSSVDVAHQHLFASSMAVIPRGELALHQVEDGSQLSRQLNVLTGGASFASERSVPVAARHVLVQPRPELCE